MKVSEDIYRKIVCSYSQNARFRSVREVIFRRGVFIFLRRIKTTNFFVRKIIGANGSGINRIILSSVDYFEIITGKLIKIETLPSRKQ